MQWLAEICVKRPVFATVLILVLCVIGLAGYRTLGVDRFPNIDLPVVAITTTLPGAAPEDVETEITDKVEEAVNTIGAIDELRSISAEGVSQVFITFKLEKSTDVAAQEVRDRVNTILPDLPKFIDLPIVTKMDPDASPILYASLTGGDRPIQEVTEFADKVIRRQIENVSGVGQVRVLGGRKRQVNVILEPLALRAAGVSALDVERAISAQNLTQPGGRLDTGPKQLTLRIHGRVASPDEIGDLVVKRVNDHSITVRDVAKVEDGAAEVESSSLRDGKPNIVLAVRKQSGSNTVAVAESIRERIDNIRLTLPPGYKLDVLRDESGVIKTSVNAVKEHLFVGALLAALIVFLFLGNLRSTVIAAIAIPTSIIGTFGAMWYEGFTLNTITLLALALAVGIVIDDAIVVLENIFRYVDEKGVTPMVAAVQATKEIGLAVLATTLSLIAVFMPIAFLGGIPGRFLKSFGVTMAMSIAVSLLVSFSLTPMMASRWLKAKGEGGSKRTGLERVVDVFYRPIERGYQHLLAFVMKKRWIIVTASLVTLGSCVPLVKVANKGFLPRNDDAQLNVSVRAPEGTSIASTGIIAERIARDVRRLAGVESTLVTVADDERRTQNLASVYVRLIDPVKRAESQDQLMDRIRREILAKQSPELRLSVGEVSLFSGGGFSTARVQYSLTGPDLARLETATDHILARMRKVPGAVDVDSSLVVGKPEVGVHINRARAADLGVQVIDVANALRLLVGGVDVSRYEEKGEEYAIHLRADSGYRADEAGLRLLTVPSTKLGQVPLADVVELRHATGPAQINRFNRQRQVQLLANAAPGYGDSAIADAMRQAIEAEKLPSSYVASTSGQTREMGRTLTNFVLAFLMSFVFMYLVLAAQFESWLHPVTILLSLPLTLPFAFLSVIIFKQAIDIYSALGILVLFGVVKKNAILQIDHTNQLRREGMDRLPAILQANRDRLRPILMTTFAFVAGMIPLVLSKGVGSGFNRATAGVVVGGQLFSLLLTLLATPVAYSLFDDASIKLRRLFGMKPSGEFREESFAGGTVSPVGSTSAPDQGPWSPSHPGLPSDRGLTSMGK